ncbi:helix-turn-helix domain-containing protein [Pontibacter silvestris]|uniref:Helix-turn-helix domain-containing protein n=1 Tax=Pontibacter silvestris TaxID=2305183 RepID=A0ABW4WXG1_9BACT|nr:AraC family transcriptional regulator [Pontibacter silvestris]MCC9138464.1 AraC family transcriptional regulator [Pontibacter silvestris]
MDDIKTFSLSKHSRLFSVQDNNREYLFVQAADHPYLEEPYRAESYAIAFLKEGGIHLQAGLKHHDIEAPSIIALAPSVIRSFRKRKDLMKMDILFFKDTFLLERHADLFFLVKHNFFETNDLHVVHLEPLYETRFKKIFELIELTQSVVNHHQAEIIRNYIFALVYEIDAYYRQYSLGTQTLLNAYPLFAKFRQLLARNYMKERKLDFYARQLHVTRKYLSAAIKKQTGKSAGEWIDETITLEAKVLLQNRMLTVSQVSEMLNFSDQSVFGKFFKANTGMSPVEYRKKT